MEVQLELTRHRNKNINSVAIVATEVVMEAHLELSSDRNKNVNSRVANVATSSQTNNTNTYRDEVIDLSSEDEESPTSQHFFFFPARRMIIIFFILFII